MTKPWERDWSQPQGAGLAPAAVAPKPWERDWSQPMASAAPAAAAPEPEDDPATIVPDDRMDMASRLSRLPKQRLAGGRREFTREDYANAASKTPDLALLLANGFTANHADRLAAGAVAALGGDYTTVRDQIRSNIERARENTNGVGKLAEFTGSVAGPGLASNAAIRAAVGPGQSAAKFAATTLLGGGAAAAQATTEARGERKDGDWGAAAAEAAPFAAGLAVGIPVVGRTIGATGTLAKKGIDRVREAVHPTDALPLASTTDFAIKRIANSAEEGGIKTTTSLGGAINRNSVPNTPSALVNTDNDRLTAVALDAAKNARTTRVARSAPAGQTQTDVLDEMVRNQRLDGTQQADALRGRMYDAAGVPGAQRNPASLEAASLARTERGAADMTATATTNRTSMPGVANLLKNSRDAQGIYKSARDLVSVPGPSFIPREQIPVLPREFGPAVRRWQRERAAAAAQGVPFTTPRPVRVSDTNIPAAMAAHIDASASAMSKEGINTPARSLGAALMANTRTAAQAAPRSEYARNVAARQRVGQEKTGVEGLKAGRATPTAAPSAMDTHTAEFMRLADPVRQGNQRLGYLHGQADIINDNARNLSKVSDDFLSTPGQNYAYRTFTQGQAMPARQLRRDVANVARMQDTSDVLSRVAAGRQIDGNSAVENLAKFYVKQNYAFGAATVDLFRTVFRGTTPARQAQVLRIMTDTTGEGRRLLETELRRRGNLMRSYPYLKEQFISQAIAAATARGTSKGDR